MESAFRDTCPSDLKVIETLRYDPRQGIVRGARHLARMEATCARFGIAFDGPAAEALLARVSGPTAQRLRLTIGLRGVPELEQAALGPDKPVWRVAIAEARLTSGDPWLGVKTTNRGLYDRARAALPAGLDEMLFLNERDELCEGTITNVFWDAGDGLLTPPLSSGLLPGVLRQSLLDEGRARETVLHKLDLSAIRTIYVGNSLRGLIRAEMA